MGRQRKNTAVETATRIIAAYTRESTEDQVTNGHGLEAQRTQCIAMAVVKEWASPVFYTDEGISGTKAIEDRPALKRLMEDVRAGKVQAVIVSALDRLARKTDIVLDVAKTLAQYGVTLVSCRESFDTSTSSGYFAMTILAAVAQLERDNISIRTKEGMAEVKRKGEKKIGRLPYGYSRRDSEIIEDADAMPVVKRILAMKDNGSSLRTIVAMLNKDGIASPQGGRLWYVSTVKGIIDNREVYSS